MSKKHPIYIVNFKQKREAILVVIYRLKSFKNHPKNLLKILSSFKFL